jgi:hypothetical protein
MRLISFQYLQHSGARPYVSDNALELSKLASSVLQEVIQRYRRVLSELSAAHLGTLIQLARTLDPVPAPVLGLLSSLVARPCASVTSLSADISSREEEAVVLDGLGSGEVCTLAVNQSRIIQELLLADNGRLIRACRCRHFWEGVGTNVDVRTWVF